MIIVLVAFGAVAINAYLSPIIQMDPSDGRCHMGIPGKASIPFMAVDIAVDAALTAVFFYLLRPVVKLHGLSTISGVFVGTKAGSRLRMQGSQEKDKRETAVQRNIRILLWKSLIGSMLIMLPTIANMVQFYITKGRELALICLTLCTLDGITFFYLSHPITLIDDSGLGHCGHPLAYLWLGRSGEGLDEIGRSFAT